ncbi:unnamed protein product [Pleuronectes platessa]|uniref:Uncharacterized protein n=1 Tax=Pleuronectes platessa TaxID=8262 RepID=A0A9N7TZ18_PLEPL|nr:unnamed protein product [Pleuronectes platessa]
MWATLKLSETPLNTLITLLRHRGSGMSCKKKPFGRVLLLWCQSFEWCSVVSQVSPKWRLEQDTLTPRRSRATSRHGAVHSLVVTEEMEGRGAVI